MRAPRFAARCAFVFAVAACGGGCGQHPDSGVPPLDAGVLSPADADVADPSDAGVGGNGVDAGIPEGQRRPLPADFTTRRGIGYSGYRVNQSPEAASYPTPEQIQSDLVLLAKGQWTLLRLWDCSEHAKRVLGVIHDQKLDFKIMLGVWVAGPKKDNDAANLDQIDQCVALATQYADIVVAVSVGNETLDGWSDIRLAPSELAAYIGDVRGRVTQPVTTDDFFLPFEGGEDADDHVSYADIDEVVRAVDFLSLHVYAFIDAQYDSWQWQQLAVAPATRATAMMDAALDYTKSSIGDAVTALKASGYQLPIVIGEAGWKTTATGAKGDPTEAHRAHPVNQKMFYDRMVAWLYGGPKAPGDPLMMFWFEAFDEPWKGDDDGWGLFDTDRYAKYAIWGTFADDKPPNAPSYSDADAVYDQ